MAGYTKLFSSIVASTIWRASDHTRLVWVTMLAMADRHGVVEASIPGLADLARVPVEACRAALLELQAPDPDSRTQDLEGRRIQPCDGGWRLVNHAKFRAKMSADDRREYLRQKQAERRARLKLVNTASTPVADCQPSRHIPEADPDPKADQDQNTRSKRAARSRSLTVPDDFVTFWNAYPRKVGKPSALRAWFRQKPPIADVLAAIARTKWDVDPTFRPHPSTWLNDRRWEDAPPQRQQPLLVNTHDWTDECIRLHHGECRHRAAHELVMMRGSA